MMLLLGTVNLFTGQAHAQFSSPVHDVENPDLQPVAIDTPAPILIKGGVGSSTLITVPAGKRLVVDFVAGTSIETSLPIFVDFVVQETSGLFRVVLPIPIQQVGPNKIGIFAQPIKLYAEPGESIMAQIFDETVSAGQGWSVSLVGHFVNLQ